MNGLDLLSSVTNINMNTLHIKMESNDRNINELTLKELVDIDMDDFKGLQLIDNIWTLVFESPKCIEEPQVEEKPKRKRRTKEEIAAEKKEVPEIKEETFTAMNTPEEEVDVFDLFA